MASYREEIFQANKISIIIVIILTSLPNAALLFKYLRVRNFVRGPVHFSKMALSLGNLLLAAYTYVIFALQLYRDYPTDLCVPAAVANSYISLLNFVFGLSITLIACDVSLRSFRFWDAHRKLISLGILILPWLLGLIIIIPLELAGRDWTFDFCWYNANRSVEIAIQTLSTILPACISLLYTSVLMGITMRTNRGGMSTHQQDPGTSFPLDSLNTNREAARQGQGTLYTNHNTHLEEAKQGQRILHPSHNLSSTHFALPQAQIYSPTLTAPLTTPPPPLPPPQVQMNDPTNHRFLQAQINNSMHPPPPQAQTNDPTPTSLPQAQINNPMQSGLQSYNAAIEVKSIFWSSLIFFVSAMPYSCYAVFFASDPVVSIKNQYIIRTLANHMYYLFPILVPIVWLRYFRT